MANLKLQTGAGGLPAAPNALALADLLIVGQSGGLATVGTSYRTNFTDAKALVLAGLTAASVANVPAGNIAATNVQTALNELDSEKAGLALSNTFTNSNLFTGVIGYGQASGRNVEFTQSNAGTSPGTSAAQFVLNLRNSDGTTNNWMGIGFLGGASGYPNPLSLNAQFTAYAGGQATAADFVVLTGATELLRFNATNGMSFGGTIVVNGARTVMLRQYTVATLPAATGANPMQTASVSDALGPVFGAAVVGGGAVKVPVYDNGAWAVG